MMNAVEICVRPKSSISDRVARCAKINECYKIKVILGKDLLDFQYAEAIRYACERCH
jgi:hypothetical protein